MQKLDVSDQTAFHSGEIAAQARVGMDEKLANVGNQYIRPYFLDQHRQFFEKLPFIVVSGCDSQGLVWITLLMGHKGFIRSTTDKALTLNTTVTSGDALEEALKAGTEVGLIGIELHSKRRNRASGTITKGADNNLHFTLNQSYGNCPKYITPRTWQPIAISDSAMTVSKQTRLTQSMQQLIANADTLFVGSGYLNPEAEGYGETKTKSFGMDASHRGGPSGFVVVLNDRELVLPDYSGNNFFNTIGNLSINPQVGLLFIDFNSGDRLQINGRATVDWGSEKIAEHEGAKRLLNIEIDHINFMHVS